MAESQKVSLVAPEGVTLAEFLITDAEEGWFTGTVVRQSSAPGVEKALAWYDEVLRDQMLSDLDDAVAAVQRFELQAQFPDGSTHTQTTTCTSAHRTKSRSGSLRFSRHPSCPP